MTRHRERAGVWTRPVTEAIDRYWKENAFPPTMRDVMNMTGISTKSIVQYEYRRLAEQGVIDIIDGKPRPRWVKDRLDKRSPTKEAAE